MKQLSAAGRDQLALALILLKDFKSSGHFDIEVTKMIFELAENIGVKKELDKFLQ